MTPNSSFRDIEKLSAYLDGELKPSEIARLETRLQSEPELASVLKDLRQARGILRQLPQRRAPRNFTLTPKMVGLKPPMPRTYPVFRFATVLATLLLFFTFATNFMAPRMERVAVPYGIGGSGGGGGDAESEMEMEAAPEAPAEEPAMEAPLKEPPVLGTPTPTLTPIAPVAEDGLRVEPTLQTSAKSGVQDIPTDEAFVQKTAPIEAAEAQWSASPISTSVQIILAAIAAISALVAFILRYITIRKWREKAR